MGQSPGPSVALVAQEVFADQAVDGMRPVRALVGQDPGDLRFLVQSADPRADPARTGYLPLRAGVGKSHAAQALGHIACRKRYEVTYERTSVLLDWIHAGRGDGTYQRRLRRVGTVALLVLDDFGLTPLPEHQQQDLYEVICNRYERRATVITSNRDFNEWPLVFANPLMASATMDRLVHRAVKIVIEGKSYRMDSFVRRSRELPQPSEDPQ